MSNPSITTLSDVNTDGVRTITATLRDGVFRKVLAVTSHTKNFDEVASKVDAFDNGYLNRDDLAAFLWEAVDRAEQVARRIAKIDGIMDGRMTFDGSHIKVDHEVIDPVLEAHILRMLDENLTAKDQRNWVSFARFVNNLYSNASEFVRNQLFGWMNYEVLHGDGFTLTDDGCFLAYKGCEIGPSGAAQSIYTGRAIADGIQYNGHIPNKVGSIVEMPRFEVEANPAVGCAPGLHAGTYKYAHDYARGIMLLVKVNPRDVVSVPVDCAAQKIRACRYEVLKTIEVPLTDLSYCVEVDGTDDCINCGKSKDGCTCESLIGKDVTFDYTRKDGVRKPYEVNVTEDTREHLKGYKADGDFSSFIKSKIENLSVVGQDKADDDDVDVTDDDGDDTDYTEFIGKTVEFDYTNKKGVRNHYILDVTDYTPGNEHLCGHKNGTDYREFWVGSIENIVESDDSVRNPIVPVQTATVNTPGVSVFPTSETVQPSDLKPGDVVTFDYHKGFFAGDKSYTVEVDHVDSYLLDGIDKVVNHYKSFRVDNISNLCRVDADTTTAGKSVEFDEGDTITFDLASGKMGLKGRVIHKGESFVALRYDNGTAGSVPTHDMINVAIA